jgi:hypothetical protein
VQEALRGLVISQGRSRCVALYEYRNLVVVLALRRQREASYGA